MTEQGLENTESRVISGITAVRRGAGQNPRIETSEGVIIFPGSAGQERTADLREGLLRRLPEFYPSDPEEAFRMARSACLYADTYRTPILIRLAYEVRFGMMEFRTEVRTVSERRRYDYLKDRRENRDRSCCVREELSSLPAAFSDSAWNRVSGRGKKGIIVRGPAYLKLSEILNGFGGCRVLKLGTSWPFPEERVRDFLIGLPECLVLDETRCGLLNSVYAVKGKYDLRGEVRPFFGEESSEEDLFSAASSFLGKEAEGKLLPVGVPAERSLAGMPFLPSAAAGGAV